MDNNEGHDSSRDFLYFTGGLALMVLGAGLIASHPAIRKSLKAGLESVLPDVQNRLGMGTVSALVPDIQRYMKLRSM
ncbi:MAG: hypothetical protein M3R68_10525 [Acidobacteriota bacterium]|jgi:hypothetical protein|nr:hypothetical protein [Acidobacteriota bacterium]